MDDVMTVKSPEREATQAASYRARQDELLKAIGLERSHFPCLDGITPQDELIIVWASDFASWDAGIPPRNLVWSEVRTGSFEYAFMPLEDDWRGTAECGS